MYTESDDTYVPQTTDQKISDYYWNLLCAFWNTEEGKKTQRFDRDCLFITVADVIVHIKGVDGSKDTVINLVPLYMLFTNGEQDEM